MLETCAKRLSELCALCERKKSPACCLCVVTYSGSVLFLTEYTEEQNTQRSIKIAAPPPTPPPEGRGVITEIPL